jgi:predicted esterase
MRKPTYIVILLFYFSIELVFKSASGQNYCKNTRYLISPIFDTAQIDTCSLVYGHNANYMYQTKVLSLTLTYPKMRLDVHRKRPLLVLFHGGGFHKGSRYEFRNLALAFAFRGYVVATVDYRVGGNTINYPAKCLENKLVNQMAIYRALQDAQAAMRFLVSKADDYRIDTSMIFVGGSSAGAILALGMAFISQSEFDSISGNMSKQLGPLDSVTNELNNTFHTRGVICFKGAIMDTLWIQETDSVPILFFHGTDDAVYPYTSGEAFSCAGYQYLYGPKSICQRIDKFDIPYELNYYPGIGHEFGFNDFEIEHILLFMKGVMCGDRKRVVLEDGVVRREERIR